MVIILLKKCLLKYMGKKSHLSFPTSPTNGFKLKEKGQSSFNKIHWEKYSFWEYYKHYNHLLILKTEGTYGISLFSGLVYQFFYLRDIFLQVILKLLDGFKFVYQSISFLFQIFHSGICICNCTEQDERTPHTRTHVHTHPDTRTNTCIYTPRHTHIHTPRHMHMYTHTQTHAQTHVYIHAGTHTCTHTHMLHTQTHSHRNEHSNMLN